MRDALRSAANWPGRVMGLKGDVALVYSWVTARAAWPVYDLDL